MKKALTVEQLFLYGVELQTESCHQAADSLHPWATDSSSPTGEPTNPRLNHSSACAFTTSPVFTKSNEVHTENSFCCSQKHGDKL